MPRVIQAFEQFFDDDGDPLVNGWLRFLVSGTTSTDKNTYSDISETIANTNPLQLDASGRCPDVYGSGTYRVISYTHDPVAGAPGTQIQLFDPVGELTSLSALGSWNSGVIYTIGQTVQGDDLKFYRSLTNPNQGNDPTSDTVNWEEIQFIGVYNANKTYPAGELVRVSSGVLYISQTAANTGNNPESDDGTNWMRNKDPNVIQSGGGALTPYRTNYLTDSNTYYLPLANTMDAGGRVRVHLPNRYSQQTPQVWVSTAGSDTIESIFGTDADGKYVFNANIEWFMDFVTDGTSVWSV